MQKDQPRHCSPSWPRSMLLDASLRGFNSIRLQETWSLFVLLPEPQKHVSHRGKKEGIWYPWNWSYKRMRGAWCDDWGLWNSTQTYILGLGLAHPIIFPIYDLLECVKGLVLQNNSWRISMTRGNSGISERSVGKGLGVMVCQRPWTIRKTHCNEQWTFCG